MRYKMLIPKIVVLLIFLSFIASSAMAVEKFIKYLPSNTKIDSVHRSYTAKTLKDSFCVAALDYAQRYSDCLYCVETLKGNCPNCCLTSPPPTEETKCTIEADVKYGCSKQAFSADSCQAVKYKENDEAIMENCDALEDIPHAQLRGCPSFEPDGKCNKNEDNGLWYCSDNNLIPKNKGCLPIKDTLSGYIDSNVSSDYYTVTKVESSSCPTGLPPPSSCYEYNPTTAYSDYVSSCQNYTDYFEKCSKGVECCKAGVCSSANSPGFLENCSDPACKTRLENEKSVKVANETYKTCWDLTVGDCVALEMLQNDCLGGDLSSSNCGACFAEIDPGFHYDFIARSGESLVVIWQIIATPEVSGSSGSNNYFYTMVKILDNDENPIYYSKANQKSFTAAFTIFAATSLNKGLMGQGKKYKVRLYYYIPSIEGSSFTMHLKKVQLIVIRTRE